MRSGWTSWIRTAAAGVVLAAGVWAQSAGAAEIRNVTAKYTWPWGVGISYEVGGTLAPGSKLIISATDREKNATYTAAASALSGDTGFNEGVHRVTWNLDQQGVVIQSTNVVFTVEYEEPPLLYCVVDLSAGWEASSYPVTYMDEPPDGGFNTDEYKTTKLVLRRIDAGSFTMGSPSSESGHRDNETQHKVTLTKPFYIGVFEVTQKQYALVTGYNPSHFSPVNLGSNPSNCSEDKRPVEYLSWIMIRGSSLYYDWPSRAGVDANTFMGRLRARTGLEFDLPTEAQWEYACRAGTTTAYSYGASANGDYMWYGKNSSWQTYSSVGETHEVGTKKPNVWGLYDMHGNVWEWCLDHYAKSLGTAAVTDPKGASSGDSRVLRGGSWDDDGYDDMGYCRSAYRLSSPPDRKGSMWGFRLSMALSAE